MSFVLAVKNILKSYEGNVLLQDCTYSFEKKGVYVIMGKNGAGKSTFLRICSLLEMPDNGEITFLQNGVPLVTDITLKRRISLVLPKVGVFNTNVFKNMAYGLKLRGIDKDLIEQRVTHALHVVGLIHKKHQNAQTLSSGETQRLGIARAMVIEPEILFLDEPTASIDEKNTNIIEGLVLDMKRTQSAIILTTHDKTQAERLADVLLTIQGGKIVEV